MPTSIDRARVLLRAKRENTLETLTEAIALGTPRVDREAGVIHDVKILGRVSKNGRVYSDQAIASALSLYEGAEVLIDHEFDPESSDRSISESFGVLHGIYEKDGALYARELRFLRSHPLAEIILEKAERFPTTIGLSHHAEGPVRRLSDGTVEVEDIVRVHSVDLVRNPATNAGLFESQRKESPTVRKKIKAVLESVRKVEPRAARLLEMDGDVLDDPMAAEMSYEEEMGSGPMVDEAVGQMVLAVLADESLDKKAKMDKIAAILDAVMDEPAAPAEVSEEEMSDEEKKDEPVAESVNQKILAELARLRVEREVRELIESEGLSAAQLGKECVALLESQRTESARRQILALWQKPAVKARPVVRALRESSVEGGSYDDLKASLGLGR